MTRTTTLTALPSAPHAEKVTDKYDFVDTREIADNMLDLGFEAVEVTTPSYRTPDGLWGTHQVDFRPIGWQDNKHQAERVLFINSYDGSRSAQMVSGLIRFACLNGLIVGDDLQKETFRHIGGSIEEELLNHMKRIQGEFRKTWTKIDHYQGVYLDDQILMEMAREGLGLRYPEDDIVQLDIDPAHILLPRRVEDNKPDLYTAFNVMQENLIRGGVSGYDKNGQVRTSQPVRDIDRSKDLNSKLWTLMESYANEYV